MGSDRYRMLPDLVRIPVGDGGGLVLDIFAPDSGDATSQLLDAATMGMLSGCVGFATLEQHAAAIARDVQQAPETAVIERRLGELAHAGLLTSEQALRAALREGATGEGEQPTLSAIGVPTRGRPKQLSACLASHIRATGERPLEIVVADDAQNGAEAQATRQVLAALALREGVTLLYAGRAEKLRYADALAACSGVEPELVRFAIAPDERREFGAGANRNALLLHQAGSLALQVDDDTRAELAPLPQTGAALSLDVGGSPEDYWFPKPGADADSLRVCEALDPCALHQRALGRSVRACIAEHTDDAIDVSGVTGMLLRRLRHNAGRVLTTQLGIAGDAATGSLAHYLMLPVTARKRLLSSEAHYRHAIASRQVLRGVSTTLISDSPFCMSFALGLDHRELLPPFAPLGRNEDGIFGLLLKRAFRDGYTAFLPWTVAHRPPARRS